MFPKAIVGRGRSAVWPEEKEKYESAMWNLYEIRVKAEEENTSKVSLHFIAIVLDASQT